MSLRIGLVPGVWSYGIGSLATVLSVQEAAVAAGDTPVVFASPHFRPMLRRLGVEWVDLPGRATADYPDGSAVLRLDDLLSESAYTDADFVEELVRAQTDAFAAHGVDVVFHDYDLTSVVAANRLGIPVVSPVTWPDHRLFGAGAAGHQPPATTAVDAFAPVLGHDAPGSLSELLFDRSTALVFPLPEVMDPIVALHARGEYVGRLHCRRLEMDVDLPAGSWPRPGRLGVLAYTSGPPFDGDHYLRSMLDAFEGTEIDALITTGRPGPGTSWTSPAGNVRTVPLAPLGRLLADADVLVCHGGRNTLAAAVAHGVPALVFAGADPERGYFADMLARQGLALDCAAADWAPDRLRTLVRSAADTRTDPATDPSPPGARRIVELARSLTPTPAHR
ncbi:glycosyltransferase [Pseudonocardia sp. CA-107938]|uniref:glycosyltransferase n=1 Tax=Pseudonocardia sp. CA-107938 TaxID=3240021 RepID=UPI003D93A3CD